MPDTQWLNKTAAEHGVDGDPNIHKMMEIAIQAERDRCYAIVERARFGEIDRDWRSILSRIESGSPANEE